METMAEQIITLSATYIEGFGAQETPIGTYCGELRDGIHHGQGVLKYSPTGCHHSRCTGDYYCGQWQDGKRHGHGMEKCNDEVYQGQWVNDQRCGVGLLTFINDKNMSYHGQFDKNMMHGTGTWIDETCVYNGKFENGRRQGEGVAEYADGRVYAGEWVQGHEKYTVI